jgi:hypothetical protein
MEAFLKPVAEFLYQNYKADLANVCMVFPNRRAGVFFSRYLAQYIDKPIWMPNVKTIAELMQELSGYQAGDPLTLIFYLYQVYEKEKKTAGSFDEFYYWGEMLLNDFDDIDKYQVDTKQIFQNLSDLKDIEKQFALPEEQIRIIKEFWTNIRLHESSPLKEDFISVWEILHTIYIRYKELLRSKGIAYEGMMCRDACDNIMVSNRLNVNYQRFAIIGFNALNECEKVFFKFLKKNDIADFFWDYDDYYVNNAWHEAGRFIRENRLIFPSPPMNISHNGLTAPKNIEIVAVPSDIGQAKLIPDILSRWKATASELTETAIVLADEKLLVPVLSSLPMEVPNVNVTLGYPLSFTPVFSFFEALVSVHRNVKQTNEGNTRFYYRDIVSLLHHPYLQIICSKECKELLDYIVRYNRIFLTVDELAKHPYLTQLFKISKTSTDFLNYLIQTGAQTVHLFSNANDKMPAMDMHREYWLVFITSLNRLHDMLSKENIILEIPTLIRILRKMTSGLSVPFKGEPLAGLQVMGVLETRTLDFSNIILLSTNEGVLPKSDASTSFIPYNLRRGFGLPTIEHQDALYAYYFYRLLQRAKNVALLYNSQGGHRSGEMSRFLFQLTYEQAFKVTAYNSNFRISLSEEQDITIPKNEEVMKALRQFTGTENSSRYLTPTALNAYLECSLRFYYRYIAHIQEKEDVIEDIEGSMFGKLLHNAMEHIYTPYLKKSMTDADFKELVANKEFIETCILKAFATEFFKREGDTPQLHGKSLVVKEVLKKYILRILDYDKSLAPLMPLEFEKTYQTSLEVEVNGVPLSVLLGGKIDRIDKTGDAVRVIDYKTGKVDCKFLGIPELFEVSGKKQNKEALQILLYAYILSQNQEYKHLPIVAGLYGMRDIFRHDFDSRLYHGKNEVIAYFASIHEPYLQNLKELLGTMFDPSVPFTKVADKKVCVYCDYKEICHR